MKTRRWPTLFKMGKTGKMQRWEIWVIGPVIHSVSGQDGGKQRQTSDTIKAGKNLGRANATTPQEQAIAEAQSKYEKQLDRGYIADYEAALRGAVAENIKGGFFPMLAEKYAESKHHIEFPCYVQPKLDGLRAVYSGGALWSRSRKEFPALKHLAKEIFDLGLDGQLLDGEAYSHDMRDKFEEIVGAVKRNKSNHPMLEKIEYHIFDLNDPGHFGKRLSKLRTLFSNPQVKRSKFLRLVETKLVQNEKELLAAYEEFRELGYEGIMVRNQSGEYENRRSNNLQKLKMFDDDEFRIVGIEEGRGALQGHVGNFICEMEDILGGKPKRFSVKMKGTGITKFLKECFEDESLWKGKWLQVQYQGLTNANGVPRFPTGLRMREAE